MKIIKFTEYMKESNQSQSIQSDGLSDNDGILIIVDIQKEFQDFIPKNFISNVTKYCKEFPITEEGGGVYQIWDSNKAQNYSYIYPNTIDTIKKNYGTNFDKDIKKLTSKLEKKYGDIEEGRKFRLKDTDTYLVRINNNHKWFFVNDDLNDLFKKLEGKKVVVVGGAGNECVTDVYIAMKSFGIIPTYNYDYIYDAQMNDEQVATPKT